MACSPSPGAAPGSWACRAGPTPGSPRRCRRTPRDGRSRSRRAPQPGSTSSAATAASRGSTRRAGRTMIIGTDGPLRGRHRLPRHVPATALNQDASRLFTTVGLRTVGEWYRLAYWTLPRRRGTSSTGLVCPAPRLKRALRDIIMAAYRTFTRDRSASVATGAARRPLAKLSCPGMHVGSRGLARRPAGRIYTRAAF